MEWAVLVLALALVLGLGVVRALRDRRQRRGTSAREPRAPRPGPRRPDDPDVAPEDEAELAREFAAVEAEGAHTLEALLELRLRVLSTRRVPLRAIRAAPGPHTGRLAFADSTVLLARARHPGELYRLALAIPDNALTIDAWSHEQDGTVLTFTWLHESAEIVVIGLDQND
ncbi:hypothetical protein MWU75_01025 [Ornithinimicrobium sp. F0845]|uniref:hypothetical protein n=1 Tax=Ornithinimicrobium sp. F0845 TaxID=2926412 RepID=UPI001FF52DA7|nr:hypothetical protein [Ornithinimicrobium sp. F0845]MCK0110726.1 hypothetical protein [Ornithinimicrobium sp. F0845]